MSGWKSYNKKGELKTTASGGSSTPTSFELSTTGNVDDLDFNNANLIICTNATLTTIRGLKAGDPGQLVSIISRGAGQVNTAHQNGSSSAPNRLVNKVTSGITPAAAGSGTFTYQYDDVNARWVLVNHEQGDWIDVPYNAGDYTADSSTWGVDSGDVDTYKTYLRGTTLTAAIWIDDTDVGSGNNLLFALIPNGWTIRATGGLQGRQQTTCFVSNAGSVTTGLMQALAASSTTKIGFAPSTAGGTWTATTSDNTKVHGVLPFEID